jgi:NAD+ kinase
VATVAFVVHAGRPDAVVVAEDAAAWLRARGHEARLTVSEDGAEALQGVDLAVSLGGDGTMLRTVELAHGAGVPILGVNLGHLGYLTAVEPSGLRHALEQFLAGDYGVHERMTLDVSLARSGSPAAGAKSPASRVAFNEAVVEKCAPGHTIRLALSIAGQHFVTYAADGLIVSTPTGSTAYNLSSRGPIASPYLRAIIVTPVSPHMLFDRSLVLEPGEGVQVELVGDRPAVLVVDGIQTGEVAPGDVVTCRASGAPVCLVDFGVRDFHSILKAKFGLADRSER